MREVTKGEMYSALRYFKRHSPAGLFDKEIKEIHRLIEEHKKWEKRMEDWSNIAKSLLPMCGEGHDQKCLGVIDFLEDIRDFGKEDTNGQA
jgi:hypothetical protein